MCLSSRIFIYALNINWLKIPDASPAREGRTAGRATLSQMWHNLAKPLRTVVSPAHAKIIFFPRAA